MAFDFYIFIIFVCFPFYDVFLSFRFENILFICSSQKSREQSQDFKGSNITSVLILLHLRGWFLVKAKKINRCAFLNGNTTVCDMCKNNPKEVVDHILDVVKYHKDKDLFLAPYLAEMTLLISRTLQMPQRMTLLISRTLQMLQRQHGVIMMVTSQVMNLPSQAVAVSRLFHSGHLVRTNHTFLVSSAKRCVSLKSKEKEQGTC